MKKSLSQRVKQVTALLVSLCVTVTAVPLPASPATPPINDPLEDHQPLPSTVRSKPRGPSAQASLRITPSLQPVAGARTNALSNEAITPGASKLPVMERNPLITPPPQAASLAEAKPGQQVTSLGTHSSVFIENKGQWDERARFQLRSGGKTLWLTNSGIVFDNRRPKVQPPATVEGTSTISDSLRRGADPHERLVFYEDFVDAAPSFLVEPIDSQPGAYNYLIGSDSTKWQTGARGYGGVIYRNVWEGVDFRVSGNGPNLEQEFIVKPGADLSQVRVAYRGIDGLEIAKDGSLLIGTAAGEMRETAPRIYQQIDGRLVSVEGRFRLLSATSYTFEVPTYNDEYALVIDPTLLYSTFLGGSNTDVATGIAVDSSGNAYVTGYTASQDFQTTPGAYQSAFINDGVGQNMFVTKLNPTGSGLVYSTYLSGASYTSAIAVDAQGNAYVAGWNARNNFGFPTTPNAYSQSCSGSGFLTVLNQSGSGLVYSTCFGSGPVVTAMAADSSGHAFITGYTSDPAHPTTLNAYQRSYPGARGTSAFVMAFDTTASGTASLAYSTYFGIPDSNFYAYGTTGNGIAVDPFGNAYITGYAGDSLPVTAGAFQTSLATGVMCNPYGGQQWVCPDAFVAKFNPSASGNQSLIYSTYLGGPGSDIANAIAVDASGNAYVTGITNSQSFPVTLGAFQSTGGGGTGFVSKFDASGSKLLYSTYMGCGNPAAIAVDRFGNASLTGTVVQSCLPVTSDAFQIAFSGNSDAFLTELNSSGSSLIYSTYFGGHGDDAGTSIALDPIGDAYIAGWTKSRDLPTRIAFQPSMNGSGDAFVSKFSVGASGAVSILGVFPSQGGNNGTITPTIIGSGFHYGATATLRCPSSSSIPGSNATVSSDGRTVSATFSLVGQAPGLCSVTVTNLDGTSASQQAALTVLPGGSEDVQLDLFGRNGIRGGFATTYSAGYTNRGAVDSHAFRLWISFDDFFAWSPPPGLPPNSVGQLNGTIYVGFDIPSVPAGSSGWIPIQLVAPSTPDFGHRPFTVQVWKERD